MVEITTVGTGNDRTGGTQIEIRRAGQRFHTRTDWLNSFHSFSFGPHYDPSNVGFGALRVLNDDVIAPGRGFGAHPHRDMEIVTWVLKGAVSHKDSSGGEGILRLGEVQTMTAGTGIVHSEYNASATEPLHLLQMWIEPAREGLRPGYDQKSFPQEARRGVLLPVVSNGSITGTLPIHQDATMFVGSLDAGQSVVHPSSVGERTHLYVVSGRVLLGDATLETGDAARVTGRADLVIRAEESAELVVWDLV
jgi:redox-sensitive bicupin YhaK (pirin superfamily)